MNTKNVAKSPAWLCKYLEHFSYEAQGLIAAYYRMTKIEDSARTNLFGKQGETNDALDLMAVHFRNLYEFFCEPIKSDYIRAKHYVTDFNGHQPRKELILKVNNQVSHLTAVRQTIAELPKKAWDPNEVMKWFLQNYDNWRCQLEPKYVESLDSWMVSVADWLSFYRSEVENKRV